MARRNLQGFRCLVTGASSGIGRALTLQLVEAGALVVAVARREEALRQLADEVERRRVDLPNALGDLETVVGDVTRCESRRLALNSAVHRWGGLDGLINNAGSGGFGRFVESEPIRLRQLMEVNFFAAVELIRLCLPPLQQGRSPLITNIGSILGHRAVPQMSEYCASKFALRGFTESLRVELQPLGVDVLLVSPGSTETSFYDRALAGGAAPWKQRGVVSSDAVARATLRAMRAGRREIIPSRPGRWLVWASRRFPQLVDRVMQKYS